MHVITICKTYLLKKNLTQQRREAVKCTIWHQLEELLFNFDQSPCLFVNRKTIVESRNYQSSPGLRLGAERMVTANTLYYTEKGRIYKKALLVL